MKTKTKETKVTHHLQNLFTFMACFQFDFSTIASIAAIGSSPDPEDVGGPWLQPIHCHHVGASLQNRVVLLPLVL